MVVVRIKYLDNVVDYSLESVTYEDMTTFVKSKLDLPEFSLCYVDDENDVIYIRGEEDVNEMKALLKESNAEILLIEVKEAEAKVNEDVKDTKYVNTTSAEAVSAAPSLFGSMQKLLSREAVINLLPDILQTFLELVKAGTAAQEALRQSCNLLEEEDEKEAKVLVDLIPTGMFERVEQKAANLSEDEWTNMQEQIVPKIVAGLKQFGESGGFAGLPMLLPLLAGLGGDNRGVNPLLGGLESMLRAGGGFPGVFNGGRGGRFPGAFAAGEERQDAALQAALESSVKDSEKEIQTGEVLKSLEMMGFTDITLNRNLLASVGGDLDKAVEILTALQ